MTRHVARGGMVRLAASAAFCALLASPVLAGDRALIDLLGYSEDGRYFAFEEFGIQDGSGFPYSTIYIVDLPADKWVAGSPFRVRSDSEDADLSDVRDEAHEQAAPKLEELEIYEAAFPLFVNADGDPRTNAGDEAVFGDPGFGLGEVMSQRTLTLAVTPATPGADCAVIDNEVFGFSLSLDGAEVYADPATLPQSRGCAMGYKIYAVVRPAEWTTAPTGELAIISTYPFGFEGPDRRFLVVPLD
jgi:predicted secreted protein